MKIDFKSISAILGIIGTIFLAISGLIALFHYIVLSLIIGLLGILCLVFSLYYYLRKPKKPERSGYLDVKGFKFKE